MKTLIKQIIAPLTRRLGTMAGTALAALNVSKDETDVVVAAIPIVVGLIVDLAHSAIAGKAGWK